KTVARNFSNFFDTDRATADKRYAEVAGNTVNANGDRHILNDEALGRLQAHVCGCHGRHFCAGPLLLSRHRSYRRLARVAACSNSIVAPLASKRGLTTRGLVIERKVLELVLLRRCNGNVTIGPTVGGIERLVQDRLELSVDPPVTPGLLHGLPAV